MAACEQLAERYQICMEEGRSLRSMICFRNCERHHQRRNLAGVYIGKSLRKGRGCSIFSSVGRARWKNLQVLYGLERLRPEWDRCA
ncbi:MAG: hypothetical protein ACLR8P_09020 [Clostridium fessum]